MHSWIALLSAKSALVQDNLEIRIHLNSLMDLFAVFTITGLPVLALLYLAHMIPFQCCQYSELSR